MSVRERNKKDSEEGSSLEKLDAGLANALPWEQFSAARWKGYGAEGDFCDGTCKGSTRYLGLFCILYSINNLDFLGYKARLKMIFPSSRIRSCTLQCWLEGLWFAMLFCNPVNSCPVCEHETCACSLLFSVAFVTELLYRDRI